MIRKATSSDLTYILNIIKNCTNHMIDNKIFQWNENYPSKEILKDDIKSNNLYLIEKNEKTIGCVMKSEKQSKVYKKVKWITENKKNLYVHRLAVDPKYQGKGYGIKLMDFVERNALKNNFISIRLDTFSKNKRNVKFYKKRGYIKIEDIYFPNQSIYPFYCLEKIL